MADTPPPYETDKFVADQDKEQFIPSEQLKQQQQQAPPQPLYAPQQQQRQQQPVAAIPSKGYPDNHGYPQQSGYPQQQPGYPQQQPGYPQAAQQTSSNVTVVTNQPMTTVTPVVTAYQSKPDSYITLSIFSFLCCCWLFGLIALLYSCQVDTAWASGDHLGANVASSRARSWNIASIVTGLIGVVAAAGFGISYGLRF